MRTHNARNERIKRKYNDYLKEARGQSEATVDQIASSIDRLEVYTKHADFAIFHTERVKAFKQHLVDQVSERTRARLSHATVYATLSALRAFVQWLAGQRGYKQSFSFGDWDYFTPNGATASIAKAHRPSRAPTLEEVRRVVRLMPASTEVERRNQAVVAFLTLTAGRVSAVASFQLGHFDIERRVVLQDARVVRTKNRKTFSTWLFPVDDDFEEIVISWAKHLLHEKGWKADDPLFPSTRVAVQPSGGFGGGEIHRKPWASTGPIRKIVCEAFHRADLPYPNPHAFRETVVAYGRENCVGWAAMQAWAQNLGHDSLTTTFGSYGKVSQEEQGRLVRSVRTSTQPHHAVPRAAPVLPRRD